MAAIGGSWLLLALGNLAFLGLETEVALASLQENVDHLLHTQFREMVELQEMQIELLGERAAALDRGTGRSAAREAGEAGESPPPPSPHPPPPRRS